MSSNDGLIETLVPADEPSHQDERRRSGRPDHVLPSLLPMLRDPAGAITSNKGMAIRARLLALSAVCVCLGLCLALGYAMRGIH